MFCWVLLTRSHNRSISLLFRATGSLALRASAMSSASLNIFILSSQVIRGSESIVRVRTACKTRPSVIASDFAPLPS
jgi:hypothetical protein